MPNSFCTTCGAQYAESYNPSALGVICDDERQFFGWNGQQWAKKDGADK